MRFKRTLTLLRQALAGWWNDQAPSKGAALAYYSMFSIAPLLFIMISIAGLFFGVDAVRGVVFAQLADLMGENGAEAVQEMLANVSEPKTGRWAAALSMVVLVFGATTVFGQLQSALDAIWEVPEQAKAEKQNAVWTFIKGRLLSFGLVLALAFLVVISLVLSAAMSALGKWWGPVFGEWERFAHAFDLAVSFGMLVVVFAAIYKLMPRAKIEWRDVWIGGVVTAALFTVGKFLIGLYLGKSDVGSSFGAFGSLVIVMVWVYYSAQIFLLGAEFTWVYAHQSGSRSGETMRKDQALPAGAAPVVLPRRLPPLPAPRVKPAYKLAVAAAFAGGAALGILRRRVWR